MLYRIYHQTQYSYSHSVRLKPHSIYLRPHANSWQMLHSFEMHIQPQPEQISEYVDLDGNSPFKIWFAEPTQQLNIELISQVETLQPNPFMYLLEPWATRLPIDYPMSLHAQLQGYLQCYGLAADPTLSAIVQELLWEADCETLPFLNALNQLIYNSCTYIHRVDGAPWLPGMTWLQRKGSCRDLSVLFMDVCRQVGLASRFVSGYQEGDPDTTEHDLHAWAEVYLPGAGWRAYDPTLGLVVCDRHIAVAASAMPSCIAPITGSFSPTTVSAALKTQVKLTPLSA